MTATCESCGYEYQTQWLISVSGQVVCRSCLHNRQIQTQFLLDTPRKQGVIELEEAEG